MCSAPTISLKYFTQKTTYDFTQICEPKCEWNNRICIVDGFITWLCFCYSSRSVVVAFLFDFTHRTCTFQRCRFVSMVANIQIHQYWTKRRFNANSSLNSNALIDASLIFRMLQMLKRMAFFDFSLESKDISAEWIEECLFILCWNANRYSLSCNNSNISYLWARWSKKRNDWNQNAKPKKNTHTIRKPTVSKISAIGLVIVDYFQSWFRFENWWFSMLLFANI